MVDFASATPTYSTQRRYEQIEEFDDFVAVKETFLNDTSMGLAEKTLKSEAYTGVVDFTKGGKVVATVRIDTKDEDGYANLMAAINTEIFAEDAYGAGAKAAEDMLVALEKDGKRDIAFLNLAKAQAIVLTSGEEKECNCDGECKDGECKCQTSTEQKTE